MSNDRGGNNNKPVSGEKDLGMGHESMPHGPDRGLPKKGPDLTTPKGPPAGKTAPAKPEPDSAKGGAKQES
jgi:hypothetical protein